jgi:hypothetical protein
MWAGIAEARQLVVIVVVFGAHRPGLNPRRQP